MTQEAFDIFVSQIPAIQEALSSLDQMTGEAKINTIPTSSAASQTSAKPAPSKRTLSTETVEDSDEDAEDLEKEIARHEAMVEAKAQAKRAKHDSSSEED